MDLRKHLVQQSNLDKLYLIIDYRLYNLRIIGHGMWHGYRCITHSYRDADCTYVFYFHPKHDEYTVQLKIKYDDGRTEIRTGCVRVFNEFARIRTQNDIKIERILERNAERRKRKDDTKRDTERQ